MHRGARGLFSALPAYLYNMWVYSCGKQAETSAKAWTYVEVLFDNYQGKGSMTQRLSLIPKVPQLEGLLVPSPDVDPHENALIKLLLFKPYHSAREIDEFGNLVDPYKCLYDASTANPYDALWSPGRITGNTLFCLWREPRNGN